jgi:hypothetical protein
VAKQYIQHRKVREQASEEEGVESELAILPDEYLDRQPVGPSSSRNSSFDSAFMSKHANGLQSNGTSMDAKHVNGTAVNRSR